MGGWGGAFTTTAFKQPDHLTVPPPNSPHLQAYLQLSDQADETGGGGGSYLGSPASKRQLLYAMNPNKVRVCVGVMVGRRWQTWADDPVPCTSVLVLCASAVKPVPIINRSRQFFACQFLVWFHETHRNDKVRQPTNRHPPAAYGGAVGIQPPRLHPHPLTLHPHPPHPHPPSPPDHCLFRQHLCSPQVRHPHAPSLHLRRDVPRGADARAAPVQDQQRPEHGVPFKGVGGSPRP
jgi:hypothetical protein